MELKKDRVLNWWNVYRQYVRSRVLPDHRDDLQDIVYWRNELFFNILIYFAPLSIIALIPGVYMSFLKNVPIVGCVDLAAFASILVIMFQRKLTLRTRKFVFISIFYILSIVLIYYVGKAGPGLLFLLAITVISSIIYSSSAGYYSAWANTFICFAFAVLNYLNLNAPVVADYAPGTWIAITSNLVILSFICAKCLDHLLAGLMRSLQDNKISAEKLCKANRLYKFISQVNQSIIQLKDEASIFSKSCQIAFETGKFTMTWIGKFDQGSHRIRLIDQKGIPGEHVSLFTAEYEHSGPQEQVLQTGSNYVCNHIEKGLKSQKWKTFMAVHGIGSFIILPIKKAGRIVGTFNLYAADVNFFDEEEIELLEEATKDISFALDLIENEKKQRHAEQQVAVNEKRFRALVENGTDAVAILSATGAVQYISSSIEKILGYSEAEAMKLDMFSLMYPDDLKGLRKIWKRVLTSSGVPIPGYTGRMLHKNGTWRWLEAKVTNMLHDPAIQGIVNNFRDVTEKKLLEELREFDRNNLDALINNTSDLMWSVDRDFNLITSNQTYNRIIALSGIIIKKGSSVLAGAFSTEQALRFKGWYERAFAGETFTEYEYGNVPAEYWLETSFAPIRKGEKVIGSACYMRDITERKRSEQQLINSESKLNEAQAIAHMGNWTVNFATQEALWSEETCKIYGLSPNEKNQTYSSWISFIHPEDLSAVLATIRSEQDSSIDTVVEHRILLKNGAVKYVYQKSRFEFDTQGILTGLHGIVLDITDRKLAEKEREKMVFNMLQHSKNLEQFTFIVSHNLRSPVANILGLANILRGNISEADKALSLEYLFSATERLDEIYKDLNKILQARSEINEYKEELHFNELVEIVKSSMHNLIEQEKVQIDCDFSAVTKMTSLRSYVHSVFYNLILNSIKYRKIGQAPVITITSKIRDGKIVISFQDNGVGIDLTRYGDKIFGLYHRFHLNVEGKGLGLFMVKAQVETLGGAITVESTVGQVAEFIVELPI